MLTDEDDNNTSDEEFKAALHSNDLEVPLLFSEEDTIAMAWLKNNKAAGSDGLPAEFSNVVGDKLIEWLHQFICIIWQAESMPTEWNLSVLER